MPPVKWLGAVFQSLMFWLAVLLAVYSILDWP